MLLKQETGRQTKLLSSWTNSVIKGQGGGADKKPNKGRGEEARRKMGTGCCSRQHSTVVKDLNSEARIPVFKPEPWLCGPGQVPSSVLPFSHPPSFHKVPVQCLAHSECFPLGEVTQGVI